jgi:glutamate-5-semialdehyde dehydrogenase
MRPSPLPNDDGAVNDIVMAATAARASARSLLASSDEQLDGALEAMATLLEEAAGWVLDANRADVEAAKGHLSAGLVDRLRLDEARLTGIASQIRSVASLPAVERSVARWIVGEVHVEERRVPVGVVGAIYEARPNVTADVATQLLKSRNAGVLRTGRASLRTAEAMLDRAIRPALAAAGLDPDAIGLVRGSGHETAEALVSMPALVPLVILRGSGETTRHLAGLAARHGVRTLQHADGGGVLYVHSSADPGTAVALIRQASTGSGSATVSTGCSSTARSASPSCRSPSMRCALSAWPPRCPRTTIRCPMSGRSTRSATPP